MKPHIRLYCGKWRASGPPQLVHIPGFPDSRFYPFPWGYGDSPIDAYNAWKKLQKRPTPPTIDEHAAKPGAL